MERRDFKTFLLEMDPTLQAKLDIQADQQVDPQERQANAKLSDEQLLAKRKEQIEKQRASDDPLDKQIVQLEQRLAALRLQKQQQEKAKPTNTTLAV